MNGLRGSTAPSPSATWGASGTAISAIQANVDGIEGVFTTSLQKLLDGLYGSLTAYRSAHGSFLTSLRTLAENTIIEMAHADVTLTSKTKAKAIAELITQMIAASQTVDANTVSVAVTPGGTNSGDGKCVASVVGPDGKSREYSFAETIEVTCTSDSQASSGLLGKEPFAVEGEVAESDTLSQDWPRGSGASLTLSAVDAGSTTGQMLNNGDFDAFTSNSPNSWTIGVGVAGTDIFAAGSSDDYEGDNALKFTGTGGAPLSEIYQALTTLRPNTVYAFNCWVKKSASLAAGVLSVALHDGTSIINDDAGTANNVTVAAGSVATSYGAFNGFFRTPKVLPTTVRLRVKITTALTSAESLFVDHLALAQATELYASGPFACVFSGATKFIRNDIFRVAVSNAFDGLLQTGFEQFFGMRAMQLQLPSNAAGGETILDSLVS